MLDADGPLSLLPPGSPVDIGFVSDAEVVTATGSSPSFPVLRVADLVHDADRLKAVVRTHAAPKTVQTVRETVQDATGTAEFLLSRCQFESVRSAYPWRRDRRRTAFPVEEPSHTLLVAERDDGDRAAIVVYDEAGSRASSSTTTPTPWSG